MRWGNTVAEIFLRQFEKTKCITDKFSSLELEHAWPWSNILKDFTTANVAKRFFELNEELNAGNALVIEGVSIKRIRVSA